MTGRITVLARTASGRGLILRMDANAKEIRSRRFEELHQKLMDHGPGNYAIREDHGSLRVDRRRRRVGFCWKDLHDLSLPGARTADGKGCRVCLNDTWRAQNRRPRCATCDHGFTTEAFDRHRHRRDGRCLTPAEMLSIGLRRFRRSGDWRVVRCKECKSRKVMPARGYCRDCFNRRKRRLYRRTHRVGFCWKDLHDLSLPGARTAQGTSCRACKNETGRAR